MRIISICPSNTELLAFLGAEHLLVGVDDFSDWPASVHGLPKLGPDLNIDMDKLEALHPDLVLASLSVPGMERNVEALMERNIPHLVLDPQSLTDIAADLRTVAKAIGMDASSILEEYEQTIENLRACSAKVEEPQLVYWEWWPKPLFSPGGTNWLTEISELTGARNCFADKDTANYQAEWQEVVDRDPDAILLAWVGIMTSKVKPALVRKRDGFAGMKAQDAIHIMEEELYCRPSPRLLEGAIRLGKLLHPTLYSDLTIPSFLQVKSAR